MVETREPITLDYRYRTTVINAVFGCYFLVLITTYCLANSVFPNWFWMPIWIFCFVQSLYAVERFCNERIVLENGQLLWWNRWDSIRSKIDLSEIRPENLDSYKGRDGRLWYRVRTANEVITFSSSARNCGYMLSRIIEAAHAHEEPLQLEEVHPPQGIYPTSSMAKWAWIPMLLTLAIAWFPTWRHYHLGALSPNDIPFGLIWSAIFSPYIAYAYYASRNRIIFAKDEIIWKDGFGRTRIRMSYDGIERGAFSWSTVAGWGAHYFLKTNQGTLCLPAGMRDCQKLVVYLRYLTNEPYLALPLNQIPELPRYPEPQGTTAKAT